MGGSWVLETSSETLTCTLAAGTPDYLSLSAHIYWNRADQHSYSLKILDQDTLIRYTIYALIEQSIRFILIEHSYERQL